MKTFTIVKTLTIAFLASFFLALLISFFLAMPVQANNGSPRTITLSPDECIQVAGLVVLQAHPELSIPIPNDITKNASTIAQYIIYNNIVILKTLSPEDIFNGLVSQCFAAEGETSVVEPI